MDYMQGDSKAMYGLWDHLNCVSHVEVQIGVCHLQYGS